MGKDGNLPWCCPEDMTYFREQTRGHLVVMGRKTADSLLRALPNRKNFVLTRQDEYPRSGFIHTKNIEQVIDYANQMAPEKHIFVIGGAEIYSLLRDYVDELHHTIIAGDYEVDTYFPRDFVPGHFIADQVVELSERARVVTWKRP